MRILPKFKLPTIGTPNPISIAQKSLNDAKLELLAHQASAEYHASMCEYYRNTVTRLGNYVKQESKAASA